MANKEIWFDGVKFTRDDKTGYYLNSTIRKRLHIYVWEYYNGAIPKGYEVHHKDHDKDNNDISNLELLARTQHRKLHGAELTEQQRADRRQNMLESAIPAAAEWHSSDAGREWHKEQYERTKDRLHAESVRVCDNCGKEFMGKARARFCSNACKSAYRRKSGVDNVERQCVVCGASFVTNKYSKDVTCSPHCRAVLGYANRAKAAEVNEPVNVD